MVPGVLAVAAICATAAVSSTAADSQIKVNLGKPAELSMRVSASEAKAGEVAFVVRNRGKLEHEFVVLRTKTSAAKLKASHEEPQTVEETGFQAELESVEPGRAVRFVVRLGKGHYVLLCNIKGHYSGGMRSDLTLR